MLQALFDLQLSSVKHYNIGTFTPDVKVHHIVLRYAQLTASLLCLNADYQVCFQQPAVFTALTCSASVCLAPALPGPSPSWTVITSLHGMDACYQAVLEYTD